MNSSIVLFGILLLSISVVRSVDVLNSTDSSKFGSKGNLNNVDVTPTLGASSVESGGKVYTINGLSSGDLDWISRFSLISNETSHNGVQVLSVYDPEAQSFVDTQGGWSAPANNRSFFAAASFQDLIYIWGGGSNQLERYNSKNNSWSVVLIEGEVPTNVYGSCSAVVDEKLYIYGGMTDNGTIVDTLLEITMDSRFVTHRWKKHQSANSTTWPSARFGCTLNNWNGTLLLFGGLESESGSPVGDAWYFDVAGEFWQSTSDRKSLRVSTPPGSAFHIAYIENGLLYITMGLGVVKQWQYVWVLDVVQAEWYNAIYRPNGVVPPLLIGYSSVRINGKLLIFSGVRINDYYGATTKYSLSADVSFFDIINTRWNGARVCYPHTSFDQTIGTCVLDHQTEQEENQDGSTTCQDCQYCQDEEVIRSTYVSQIRNNVLSKDAKEVLTQCPAVWRKSSYVK